MKKAVVFLALLISVLLFKMVSFASADLKPVGCKDMFSIDQYSDTKKLIKDAVDSNSGSINNVFITNIKGNYKIDLNKVIVAYPSGNELATNWKNQGLNITDKTNLERYIIPVYGDQKIQGFIDVSYDIAEKKYTARSIYALDSYISWLQDKDSKAEMQAFADQNDLGQIKHTVCFFSYYDGVTIYIESEKGEYAVSYNCNGLQKAKVYPLSEFLDKRALWEQESLKKENLFDKNGNMIARGQAGGIISRRIRNYFFWILSGFAAAGIGIVILVVYLTMRRKKRNAKTQNEVN